MKVSALREGTAMASPPPREMEEELVAAGSEPGAYGCRVGQGGREDGGRGRGRTPVLSWRGWVSDGSVAVGVRGMECWGPPG